MKKQTPICKNDKKILFFGAGAIGSSVGAWLASVYDEVYFFVRGELAETLKSKGITYYQGETSSIKANLKIKVVDDLSEVSDVDVIVITVKNYSLETVAKTIREKMGDKPLIIAMQNGVENQKILPKYFSKIIYCVICYNAWLDEAGTVGYEKKGPLIFGTINNELMDEMKEIAEIFNKGVKTTVTENIRDAVHCKLIYNLNNSLTTLIGHKFRPITNRALFQKLVSNTTYEGMKIVKAAGFKEFRIGNYPPWILISAAVKLPRFITRFIFEMNAKKMVILSMAQDIIQRSSKESELESITGYMLQLAEQHGINAPYNKAVYELCKVEFAKPEFTPLDVETVWERVKIYL